MYLLVCTCKRELVHMSHSVFVEVRGQLAEVSACNHEGLRD